MIEFLKKGIFHSYYLWYLSKFH